MRVILTADVSVTPAPEQFPHAMLDIETMAQHTSRALILSIAALPFALEPEGPRFGEPVLILPDLGAQLLAGRMVESRTQGFWAKQPAAASEHWLGKTATHQPAELLEALTDWLELNTAKKAELWARGQGFDFANLDNIMDAPPGKSPWWFPNLRDQRTATTFFPKLRDRPADLVIPAAAHDPVYDCMTQAWALWERAPAEAIGLPGEPRSRPVATGAKEDATGGLAAWLVDEMIADQIARIDAGEVIPASQVRASLLQLQKDRARLEELQDLINTPQLHDFAAAVVLEAAHQRVRWGAEGDAGKTPADWFWLLGHLSGKAFAAHATTNVEKALHHTISSAAALANWHAAITGADTTMRPGIEPPAEKGG